MKAFSLEIRHESCSLTKSQKSKKTPLKASQMAQLPKAFEGFIVSWGMVSDDSENKGLGLAKICFQWGISKYREALKENFQTIKAFVKHF